MKECAQPPNLVHKLDPNLHFHETVWKEISAEMGEWGVCWQGEIERIRLQNWVVTMLVLVEQSGTVSRLEKVARTPRATPGHRMRTARSGPLVWLKRTSAGWSKWTNKKRPPNSMGCVNRSYPRTRKDDLTLKQRWVTYRNYITCLHISAAIYLWISLWKHHYSTGLKVSAFLCVFRPCLRS